MSDDPQTLSPTGPTILLAEDSDDDAYFFRRALKKTSLDCSLLRAANGKVAIQMLEKAAGNDSEKRALPDVLFLDLKLPVMSGFEVLEWIKAANLSPPLKVLVLSGSNDQADRVRAAELGASSYLVKPIKADELRRHLENLSATESAAAEERTRS